MAYPLSAGGLDRMWWRWRGDGRRHRADPDSDPCDADTDRAAEGRAGVSAALHRAVTAWEDRRGEEDERAVGLGVETARRPAAWRETTSHWTGACWRL